MAKTEATKAAPRMTLLVGKAAIVKAITSIKGRAAKLDRDLHIAAVSCIKHTAQHNDPDTTNLLLDALGKSQRKQALIAWILNYGAMAQDEAGKLVYNVKKRDEVLSDANLQAAEAEPFWDFMPEKPYVQFDLAKALESLLHKAEKALEAGEQDVALISPEKLAALRALTTSEAEVAQG